MKTIRRQRPPTLEARALALVNACVGVNPDAYKYALAPIITDHLPDTNVRDAMDTISEIALALLYSTASMVSFDQPVERRWDQAGHYLDIAFTAALVAVTADWAGGRE